MRIVFDINAGDGTDENAKDIIQAVDGILQTSNHVILPSPDMFSEHPMIERRYRTLVYALAGDYLSEEKWLKLLSLISIDMRTQNPHKGMAIYYDDWWREAQNLAVGAVSSEYYALSANELMNNIREKYMVYNGYDSQDYGKVTTLSVEWLSYESSKCDIYSEDNGRIIIDDEIGSRRIISVLVTRKLLNALSSAHLLCHGHEYVKVYTVDSFVFDEDDDEGDDD